jgi:hypothetical protein
MLPRPVTSISSSMAMRLCSISSIMGSSAWPLRTRNSVSLRARLPLLVNRMVVSSDGGSLYKVCHPDSIQNQGEPPPQL